jgi:RNA polymerase sigma-70 factor, ECF subfamily
LSGDSKAVSINGTIRSTPEFSPSLLPNAPNAPNVAVCAPSMTDLERALLRRLRDRDERAFRELIELYRDRVFNVTFRMLGDRAEAEDIAQEVFIAVFKTIDTFREESKFSTWLYRVAVNHTKNRIKYLARRNDRNRTELDENTTDSEAGSMGGATRPARPDRALEGAQLEQVLQAAIGTLDEEHRVLVVLRDIEELSIEEICEITGIPDGTVKSRLHRARAALRKKLQRHLS